MSASDKSPSRKLQPEPELCLHCGTPVPPLAVGEASPCGHYVQTDQPHPSLERYELGLPVRAKIRRMRALTVWQPWATLVIACVKPFEFRRWPAPKWVWGKRIAIHAGARPVRRREIDELIASIRLEGGWGTALVLEPALEILLAMQARPDLVPTSAVLGTAVFGRPVPAAEAIVEAYGQSFRGDSERIDHSLFGWPLTEIRQFAPPLPAKGAQGFWWWTTSEDDVAIEPLRAAV